MTEWVPVADRLPDMGTIVAAWAAHHADIDQDFPGVKPFNYLFAYRALLHGSRVVWFEHRHPETWHDGAVASLEVTHWMPLPEPPK